MKHLIAFSLLIMLVGCGPKRPAQPIKSVHPVLTDEERARLHDVPFPLSCSIHKLSLEAQQSIVSLRTTLSCTELIDFYRAHMDLAGWQEEGLIEADETCMIFRKPSKDCIITLRMQEGQMCVVIFVKKKTP
jgi:hypothetical protein